MRRDKRPFLVEVRRGGKRPPAKGESARPTVEWPTLPEEDAAPIPVVAEFSAPAEVPRGPVGRILPSLIEPAPEPLVIDDEPEAPRRRGRPPGAKNKASPAPTHAEAPKRRGRPPKPRPAPKPFAWPDEPESEAAIAAAPTPAVAAPADVVTWQPRARRVSRILGRYVFGTMPKRGERWKRQFR